MPPLPRSLLLAALLGPLAACSSGGGGATPPTGVTPPPTGVTPTRTAEDYALEALALFEEVDAAGLTRTDPSTLPSGSVGYDGVVLMTNPDGDYGFAGDLGLDVAFDSNAFSGSVTDIVDTDGRAFAGSLALGNGAIDRAADPIADWTLTSSLTGRVTSDDGEFLDLDGGLGGDFLGPNAEYAAGVIEAEVCRTSGCAVYEDAAFIAAR